MIQRRSLVAFCTSVLVALSAPAAQAAELEPVSNWNGGKSFPNDVRMYVYIPDDVATKPPVLTVIHYCGGSAPAVFGQAERGGIRDAADEYGFIMVVPSNAGDAAMGRCWDVSSEAAQTRDGGGDTHAIAQMVRFALTQYQGNPDRVYAAGNSSGGMTTQLMLALYPDIFKAGVSFAGVPAGCSNVFDGSGLCGLPAQTAQQWGDRVRAMYPEYTGRRPRVQLFHGDADAVITYKNFGESIKEWTNVLGLPAEPTSTDTSLTLGTNPPHEATRLSWKNACGYVVFDAFTEHKGATSGGDHGPSDTEYVAKYVVPFLGLDKVGPVDPEVEQCAAGGGGSGGASGGGSGGAGGAGGQAGSAMGGGSLGGVPGSAGAAVAGTSAIAGAPGGAGGSSGGAAGGSSSNGAAGGSTADTSPGCGCVLRETRSSSSAGVAALAFGLALIGSLRRRRKG